MEYSYELKIPKERIAVLIGKSGEMKKKIEEETGIHIDVDSKEGDVKISSDDSLSLFIAKDIIRAISRGFNPEIAKLILKGDYVLEILQIEEYSGKSKKSAMRLKGRVIGQDGKSRGKIEQLTQTHISVYGKTIGIVGRAEDTSIARRAIESLLSGSTHTSVYRWLEKKQNEREREKFFEHRTDSKEYSLKKNAEKKDKKEELPLKEPVEKVSEDVDKKKPEENIEESSENSTYEDK
ncbi:RNA-processing protein [Candidatus Woesearchaeota archaeon]|jgi:ribosomal RNA assembly protein|nr:RNA-processing protein [Candidatus Woesearchaeota archaeon]MBT6520221.1 RNA-processing protein [Candidatus Woesearchaeota archaeon]MBT7367232.1 RNA-processing protein [Candidatus Woesearchaeota archaeon]